MLDPNAKSPLISVSQLMREPRPKIDWALGKLLTEGDRLLIFGEWGSYKTFIATSLGIHLAAGKNWLGESIVRSHRVLYIDEEMPPMVTKLRLYNQIMGSHDVEDLEIPMQLMSMEAVRFNEYTAFKLLKAMESWWVLPEVIILDAMRRVMVGDENRAEDVAKFWANINPLTKLGIMIVVLHHANKNSTEFPRDDRDRASGNTDIMAGANAVWMLKKNKGTNTGTLKPLKGRLLPERPEFEFIVKGDPEDENVPIEIFRNSSPTSTKSKPKIWTPSDVNAPSTVKD
jgi:RecA-family ATPase